MKIDEAAQLRSVEETLIRTFGDRHPEETICAEVRRVASTLEDARVRTFVPVLIQRQVGETLRRRVQTQGS